MGMTITEKILAAHADREIVRPGEFIQAKLDFILGNDITAPLAIKEFKEAGIGRVFNTDRIALVPDHFTPNKDVRSAEQAKLLREFSREYHLKYYFEIGKAGIEHVLLPEQGLVLPGDIVIGADSHTCTYGALGAFSTGVGSTDLAAAMVTGETWFKVPVSMKFIYYGRKHRWVAGKDLILYTIGDIKVDGALYKAMEFTGEAVSELSMAERFTMSNMAIEAGGKSGIFAPDEKTVDFVKARAKRPYKLYLSDHDAEYVDVKEYNVANIEMQVSFPSLPANSKPISEVGNVPIDQVVIGSCTNGWLEDLQMAARVLKGNTVHPYVRTIIIPATRLIYMEALKRGLIEIFLEAGAAVSTPTCGPCLGGHMGVLAAGERAVATTNRNFVGRMGHLESEVYLAGPAVAAASAIKGRIASPEEIS